MKKLLVLLALCMVISVVLVACDTPEQPVEDTTAGTTEAPTTGTEAPSETESDTEAPTTDTEAPTTDTEAPTTDTESETEPPAPPADPVKVGMSFDQLYTGNGPATAGEENFFAPGSSSSWDGKAVIEDYNVQYVTVWGWVAFFAEIPGTFGYQIGDADPVFDAAFFIEAEQPVVDAALAQGGKSAARMHISIPVEYLAGEEIVIKALAKDAVGTIETLVEFKLTKPVNPNAPVAFIPAAEMASSIPGSVDITGAEMSADGQYVTITTGNTNGDAYHDPNYLLPMLTGKATVAQFVAIKYRTSVEGARSEVFVGSGQGPNGQGDNYAFDVVTDGKWNLAIIDLANTPAVVDNVINYLRWDPYVGTAETSTIDMAYIALFSSAEAAIAYDANFKGVLVDTLNVPTSDWTVTGHRQGIMDSTDGMVSAGGVEFGALLHQGYIYVGDINLAEMSKVVIYFGIDGSQTTIDRYDANAQNRIILTSADQAMTNSPTEEVVLAANTYTELGWAVHAIEIDLTGVNYNGPVYVTYDTLPGTFMLISSVEFTYDPNYVEPEEPEAPEAPVAPEMVDKDACEEFDRFSFDGFYLNDSLYFETDGMANDKLAAINNTVTISGANTIGYRGWIAFKSAPAAAFGYYIVGINEEVVVGEFLQERPDLAGAGIVNGTGYKIDVPVADLAAGTYTTGMVAILADGTAVKLYEITLIVEEVAPVENYNVPQDAWTISGHCPQIVAKEGHANSPMVAAGGIDTGALLHQGSVGVGEINLANYSKAIVYIGIDNSPVTVNAHAANAANRLMLTNSDVSMVMSPEAGQIVASVDYTPCGWAITAFEIDLTGVDYNGPVFLTWDSLPGTFMLIGAIEFVA